ncbi:phosphatidylinositol-specific phospholipase C [Sinomicrobium oceani]|uniref:phosphatidylinositol-specific phospholipase C n=1 Tax=Sinomicrobium oceani TaxID=1150368 RepID=UPI00227B7698|nr:phosphatidylinositol-specific phospholipase C [Sinomicrobium oceani]
MTYLKQNLWMAVAAAMTLFSCSQEEELLPGTVNGVLHAEEVSLVTFNTEDVANWMSYLPDAVSLNNLTIPGTHDSGARHEPVSGTAKTQELSISQQLEIGVRFLDIRCRHYQDAFVIHHGSIYQHLNFDDVLNACKQFLQQHPDETIIMSVKQEYNAEGNTMSFPEAFNAYVQQDPTLWHLPPGIPELGEARGKIVLFRRFGTSENIGINASHSWGDKTTFTIDNGSYSLRIQDEYVVSSNTAKFDKVVQVMEEAFEAEGTGNTLFVSFASGYKQILWAIPNIPGVSNEINPMLNSYFSTADQGIYGVIPLDFVNAELAGNIVNSNF